MAAESNKTMSDEAPATYFEATAVPRESRRRVVQDVDTGVCIVGGGFAGLWIARALARRGYDVAVIEQGRIGGGASGRNGGLVSAGFAETMPRIVERVGLDHAKSLYALSRQGVDTVAALIAEGVAGVHPVPGRLNVQRFDDAEAAKRNAAYFSEHFEHEMLVWPTERVRETLKTERYYQALHDVDAFSVHPLNLALALAAEIEERGGRIFEYSRALAADLEGVRKWVVTERGRVRAQDVVFCGGPAIGDGFPALARTLMPLSTFMCATGPIPEKLHEAIRYGGAIADTRRTGDYFRVVGDRLLWGGRVSTKRRTPGRLARKLGRDMVRVLPGLKGVSIEHAWSGIMGYPIHRMPQIGMLRQGVWVASGFAGHGLNTTAMAGELISTAIIDSDDRWRQFIPFGLVWAGGAIGRRTMQLVHVQQRLRDAVDEMKARRRERRAKRLAAAEAARQAAEAKAAAEAAERRKVEDAERRKREQAELAKLLEREAEEEKRRKEEEARDFPLKEPAKAEPAKAEPKSAAAVAAGKTETKSEKT